MHLRAARAIPLSQEDGMKINAAGEWMGCREAEPQEQPRRACEYPVFGSVGRNTTEPLIFTILSSRGRRVRGLRPQSGNTHSANWGHQTLLYLYPLHVIRKKNCCSVSRVYIFVWKSRRDFNILKMFTNH